MENLLETVRGIIGFCTLLTVNGDYSLVEEDYTFLVEDKVVYAGYAEMPNGALRPFTLSDRGYDELPQLLKNG